jgi:HK97 family phage prohead protease
MDSENKEIRTYSSNFEIRKDNDQYIVEGLAAVYNSQSVDLGGFVEYIADGAFNDELIRRSNIFCLLNHQFSRGVLARYKEEECNSLKLTVLPDGLHYSFELPSSPLGEELKSYIERKEIQHSSFAFTVKKDKWEDYEDGLKKRTILEFNELYDVSPVFDAAYQDTTFAKRGLEQLTIMRDEVGNEQLIMMRDQAGNNTSQSLEKKEKLRKYYVDLRRKYNFFN